VVNGSARTYERQRYRVFTTIWEAVPIRYSAAP